MFGMTRAPEINCRGLTWFNTPKPLSLADLRGRIVILDFWTYCCINCLQVLPTLRRVEEEFPREVAVIGIHSPKYPAERRAENVEQAITRYDIRHPVAHDPTMALWEEYAVRAWPTLVFLSPDGYVIGETAGEPSADSLLRGLHDLVQQFTREGSLTPATFPFVSPAAAGPGTGKLHFPGKIKPCPRAGSAQWAVSDAGHHQVVVLDDNGTPLVRYGSGQAGFTDGGAGEARFCRPQGLACDGDAIWVADTGNHALRRIDRRSGQVSTAAGIGIRGNPLPIGEAIAGAALASPWDIDVADGTVYFANAGTHQIGRYDVATGKVIAAAGAGGEDIVDGPAARALLAQPSGLALSPQGHYLFFADSESSSVRVLTLDDQPTVTTLVGQGLFTFGHQNGAFDQALLQHPLGLAALPQAIIVADSFNGVLRRLDLTSREVSDIDPGDCLDPLCLPPGEPAGVAVAGPSRLLVADTNNHRIVEIDLERRVSRTWAG